MIPFGTKTKMFMPVSNLTCSAGVKIEADEENGASKVTGRELQTCGFNIHVTKVAGMDPRTVFEMLKRLKGMTSPIFVTNNVSMSLTNTLLDALQTSDWRKFFSLDGALALAGSLFLGTSLGGVSYMLTSVSITSEVISADGTLIDATIGLSFTEDAGQRQTGGLRVYINEKEITDKISVTECTYEMQAEGEADALHLSFADTKNEWSNWKLDEKDIVRVTDGVVDTGQMFIESKTPENGQYKLIAYSVPKTARTARSRSFENLSLPAIAKKIADDNKLSGVKNYGVSEQKYTSVQQRGVSDLAFLDERCQRAGASFIIFNKTLCIYDERIMENREPTKTITIGLTAETKFHDNTRNSYTSAEISNGTHTGKADDKKVATGKTLRQTITEKASSLSDMSKISNSLLRRANKKRKTGEVCMPTQRELAAGSVINIIARGWVGPAFIYRCRHDLKQKKTRFLFRSPLNY